MANCSQPPKTCPRPRVLAGARKRWALGFCWRWQLRERWRICWRIAEEIRSHRRRTPPVAFQALSAAGSDANRDVGGGSVSTDTLVIAVVDRQGKVLGVFHKAGAPRARFRWKFSAMENAD